MNISRRELMVATGVSATMAVPVIGKASTVDTVDLPVFESPDGVEKWETVPRSWNEHRIRARHARDRVTEAYLNRPGVEEVSLVAGDSQIKRKQRLKIRVEVDSRDNHPTIPEQADGVKIEVGRHRKSHQLALRDSCVNSSKFDPIPGGVLCQITTGEEVKDKGTITCTVSGDNNSDKYLLTAAHLADRCSRDPVGDRLYQSPTADVVGNITDVNDSKDWMVSDIQNRDWEDKIKLDDKERLPIKGWINDKGLETYVGSATVEKIGMRSGHTTGTLNKISISGTDEGCTNWNGDGIECKCNGNEGDSGAPIFFRSQEGKAYMIAILQQGEFPALATSCDGDAEFNRSQGYHFENFVESSDYTLPAT